MNYYDEERRHREIVNALETGRRSDPADSGCSGCLGILMLPFILAGLVVGAMTAFQDVGELAAGASNGAKVMAGVIGFAKGFLLGFFGLFYLAATWLMDWWRQT